MIEINLLPGSGKKARRGRGAGRGLGAALSGAARSIKDPFLLGGVATATVCLLAVGGLWFTQSAQARDLTDREQRAVQDSTRYAAVLAERRTAEVQRDSALRQLEIIRSIDNNRFVWAHVMDEVSRALPAYTWLTSIAQTSAAPTAQTAVPAPPKKDGGKATPAGGQSAAPAANDSATGPGPMKFQLVGQTVDIQALTRFMKDLEASPFVRNVQLAKTSIVLQDQKEVTEFQLDAEYESPAPGVIRTVPVSLSVR
jgi:Tfp pilus assembly protein PilN